VKLRNYLKLLKSEEERQEKTEGKKKLSKDKF
jgi:hypothetical protein